MSVGKKHFIVGYGSLLSADSRQHFSDITSDAIPLTLKGWKRAWHTRSTHESQTYVGAHRNEQANMNGVLLEIDDISPELQKREQDYQFVEVSIDEVAFHLPEEQSSALSADVSAHNIWVCQTLQTQVADPDHPVYQSYIDTCLLGCLETDVEGFVDAFIESTDLWHHHWLNDRHDPQYPRAAKMTEHGAAKIDSMLAAMRILEHRIE